MLVVVVVGVVGAVLLSGGAVVVVVVGVGVGVVSKEEGGYRDLLTQLPH